MNKTKEEIEMIKETKRSLFMRGYSASWMDKPTFKLMCVDEHCPFLEAIYLPEETCLIIISKQKHHKLDYVPKLDNEGNPEYAKKDPRIKGEPVFKRQRIEYEANYDYTLTDKEEIIKFVQDYGQDDPSFNFEKYLK